MESNNVTTFTDSVVFETIQDIAARAEVGLKKYNTTMDRDDLTASDWIQHAYEECLDMALYLKRLRRDMLAMEEELRAFKTQAMIKSKLEEESVHYKPCSGTKLVYSLTSKPNEVYTDEEQNVKKKYNWHR